LTKKWQGVEFGLVNKRTGEVFDAELRIARKRGGKFLKKWQDPARLPTIMALQVNHRQGEQGLESRYCPNKGPRRRTVASCDTITLMEAPRYPLCFGQLPQAYGPLCDSRCPRTLQCVKLALSRWWHEKGWAT